MEFFIENIHTALLFPLWVFLLIVVGRFFSIVHSRKVISLLTLSSTLYGLVFAVGAFLYLLKTPDYIFENSYSFLKIQDYVMNFGVYVDNLSVVMLLVVTTISFFVQFYASDYMKDDKSFSRFFSYLNLFNFSMLGLVLSSNLFQTYVFWELVGVSSYLLIGFWYKKPSAQAASKKAFIMNRVGDCGFLAGTIIVSYFMYQYSGTVSLATVPFVNINDIANYLYSYTSDFVYVVLCVLILLGAFAKSAQFPLHTWLADAMEGPTPVSALIHSATMVAAGVYLVARLYPIFVLSDSVMNFIAIIGLITAIICGYFAITQNDFKRILAYSTNSQLGLMFLALGAGAYSGGLFHLTMHAYLKSMLFLCSGIVIHSLADQQDIRFMGGLRKQLPTTAICYIVGCLSISGLLFGGFFSKEMILGTLIEHKHYIYTAGFLVASLMTVFYMFRSYFIVFEGDFRGHETPHKPSWTLNGSILALAIFTILPGYLINGSFEKFIGIGMNIAPSHAFNPIYLSISVAAVGLILAAVLYNTRIKPVKIPVLYQLSYNKFYMDEFYNFIADRLYYVAARACHLTDKYIVDGIVKFSAFSIRGFSWIFAKMQTGNFQSYLAYSLIFIALIFTGLMLAYTVIITFGLIGSY